MPRLQTNVKLKSSDGHEFDVPENAANMSETIKNMIEDTGTEMAVPLHNVAGKTLAKVIEYCKYHAERQADKDNNEEVATWDGEFVKVDQATLFDLILAANYLNIKELLELTCEKVASMIKGKTQEEIRKTFNIQNDFTPEEEEQVRKENQWAFE